MKTTANRIMGRLPWHAKNFLKLTIQAFAKPEAVMKEVGSHPIYGLAGYVLFSALLALTLMAFGTNFGFIENQEQMELAITSLVFFPLMMFIPIGFVHLNASVMKMGGSFWQFYSRVIWSIYLWFVATLIAGVLITVTFSILPVKLLGFFQFLPYFFLCVFLYLSLKVTNEIPHWKALLVWVVSGSLFYLAVILAQRVQAVL